MRTVGEGSPSLIPTDRVWRSLNPLPLCFRATRIARKTVLWRSKSGGYCSSVMSSLSFQLQSGAYKEPITIDSPEISLKELRDRAVKFVNEKVWLISAISFFFKPFYNPVLVSVSQSWVGGFSSWTLVVLSTRPQVNQYSATDQYGEWNHRWNSGRSGYLL